MQVGYENIAIFNQYLTSSRVVNSATVWCYKQCRRTTASWWHSSLQSVYNTRVRHISPYWYSPCCRAMLCN